MALTSDYRANLEQRPVRAQVTPGEVRRGFPDNAPETTVSPEQLLNDLEQRVLPGLTLGQLKLRYHLSIDGIESIRARLRRDLDNARWFAETVEGTENWRVLAPVKLQTVCIRHEPPGLSGDALDRHTLAWVNAINQSGVAFMSPSTLDERWMVRVSIGVEGTTREHLGRLWTLVQQHAERSTQVLGSAP